MNGHELRAHLTRVLAALEQQADEFQRLDAAVGDGDLGVTVAASARAVGASLKEMKTDDTVRDVLRNSALALADANPSTMSTLLSMGLLRSADAIREDDPAELRDAVAALESLYETIAAKGGAAPGDKTILDAVGPSLAALAAAAEAGASTQDALEAAVAAARQGVEDSTPLVGRRGRSAWVGDRGAGHPDPGAVLYLRFLEAWQAAGQLEGNSA